MKIHKISPDLSLIQLDQNLTGFTSFIGAWLYQDSEVTFLVDVGPAATVPVLLTALSELSVTNLDVILLTHIHIDHAGGTGDLIQKYPETPVVCHQSGIKHLADPAKLWEGSKKTLKETALAYGPISPVPEDLLQDAAEFNRYNIQPILTPGHASHHVSYLFNEILFAGEAGGVYTQLDQNAYFLRPATPPRYIYETSLESLNKLLATPHKILCYGHFGATPNTPSLLEKHKNQLDCWLNTLSTVAAKARASSRLEEAFDKLLRQDPLLHTWEDLPATIQQREKSFMMNSIRGFLGYLENK